MRGNIFNMFRKSVSANIDQTLTKLPWYFYTFSVYLLHYISLFYIYIFTHSNSLNRQIRTKTIFNYFENIKSTTYPFLLEPNDIVPESILFWVQSFFLHLVNFQRNATISMSFLCYLIFPFFD